MKAYKDIEGTIPCKDGDRVAHFDCSPWASGGPLIQVDPAARPSLDLDMRRAVAKVLKGGDK